MQASSGMLRGFLAVLRRLRGGVEETVQADVRDAHHAFGGHCCGVANLGTRRTPLLQGYTRTVRV